MNLPRILRLVAVSWWLHLKMINRSVFDSVMQVVWPLFFSTTTLFIYRAAGNGNALSYAALGAGVMTIWTSITSTASNILQRERGLGTLELLVAAPTPFPASVVSIVLAVSTIGTYGMAACLLWAHFVFGVDIGVGRPAPFVLAIVTTVFSFGVLGFILAVTLVRYRGAWALGSALEYPVWLLCGFLVPASVLPGWMTPVSWLLPPSWGMRAIREAAAGRSPWTSILACSATAVVLIAVGIRLTGTLLRAARQSATLSLR
ncbi:ABC transporter permease [Streptomyces sp. H51]|uniref:ABC transporter permease n=1 Tax=Streptomyces sp. H51 TaxID=3111770 RepID=UPI002D792EBD|nr:ABC transporter permease [Streptomyces sp. H51]